MFKSFVLCLTALTCLVLLSACGQPAGTGAAVSATPANPTPQVASQSAATALPSATATPKPSDTPEPSATPKPSNTPEPTDTPTLTPSLTPSPMATNTPTRTATRTPSPTASKTPTKKPAPTKVPTKAPTPVPQPTQPPVALNPCNLQPGQAGILLENTHDFQVFMTLGNSDVGTTKYTFEPLTTTPIQFAPGLYSTTLTVGNHDYRFADGRVDFAPDSCSRFTTP